MPAAGLLTILCQSGEQGSRRHSEQARHHNGQTAGGALHVPQLHGPAGATGSVTRNSRSREGEATAPKIPVIIIVAMVMAG